MFKSTLRVLAIACVLAGIVHALLGVGGDWLIGVAPASPIDPSLDSQNRFYGAAFIVYGVLLWMGSANLPRYAPVLRALFAVMMVAGCARGLAVWHHGWPSGQIMVLGAIEIMVPPPMWLWLKRELAKAGMNQGRHAQ